MSKRCKIKQRIIPERVIQSDSCTKCYSVCIDCVEKRNKAVAELKKLIVSDDFYNSLSELQYIKDNGCGCEDCKSKRTEFFNEIDEVLK